MFDTKKISRKILRGG